MGLLEAIVLILVGSAVGVLAWVARKVSDHDGNDRVLAARVEGLDKSLAEFQSEARERFGRLEDKLDRLLDRTAA